ncbi:MAG TPA: hypothetical protein VLH13_03300, partial [Methanomassiliicoccales archaeon]|nr:hypothetical protein [Methanomassiliicoccales archaeon]
MRLHQASESAWVEGNGYTKRILMDEGSLGIKGSFFQEVLFRKGDKVPIHHHVIQTEIFYAVTDAYFNINGRSVVLRPGDMVICEPGDRHGNPVIPHDMKILVLKIDHKDDDTVWDEEV